LGWLFSEKALKLLEVARCDVGDDAEFHASLAPIEPVIALLRPSARGSVQLTGGPDENAPKMFAAAVDQSSNGAAVNDVEEFAV
jgi:hypothetical protein